MKEIINALGSKFKIRIIKFLIFSFLTILLETLSILSIFPVLKFLFDKDKSSFFFIDKFELNYELEILLNNSYFIYFLIIFLIVIIFVIKNIALYFLSIYQNKFVNYSSASLSRILFSYYISQNYINFVSNNTSVYIRNSLDNVGSIFGNYFRSISILINESLILLILLTILFFSDPLIFFSFTLVFGSLSTVIFFRNKKRLYIAGVEMQKNLQQRLKFLQQGLGSFKDIKILGLEKYFLEQFYFLSLKIARITYKFESDLIYPKLVLEIFGIAIIFTFITVKILGGNEIYQIIPLIGVFSVAGLRLLPSVNRLITATQRIRFSIPTLKILQGELIKFTKQEVENISIEKKNRINFKKIINLKNLNFKYEGQKKNILNNLSLIINKGDFIAISGPSGCGKTTLLNMMMGLIKPNSGVIEVDGINIYENIKGWQSNLSHVPQDIYLLDDTLESNIILGHQKKEFNYSRLNKVINLSLLTKEHGFVLHESNTILGERGISLSGGQKQRVGIARALYSNADIIFLDEATSSLDPKTEQIILKNIKSIFKNKTIIMITHRRDILKFANKVFALSKGILKKIK